GEVTLMVIVPLPAVPDALTKVVKFCPPTAVAHPTVNELVLELTVPTEESAEMAMLDPAATGLLFPSLTLKVIDPVPECAMDNPAILPVNPVKLTKETVASAVDMMSRCE